MPKAIPQTLQAHWDKYRAAVYPAQISAVQLLETHQAFFAGALIMFTEINSASHLPEAEALLRMDALLLEVTAICQARADQFRNRN